MVVELRSYPRKGTGGTENSVAMVFEPPLYQVVFGVRKPYNGLKTRIFQRAIRGILECASTPSANFLFLSWPVCIPSRPPHQARLND